MATQRSVRFPANFVHGPLTTNVPREHDSLFGQMYGRTATIDDSNQWNEFNGNPLVAKDRCCRDSANGRSVDRFVGH